MRTTTIALLICALTSFSVLQAQDTAQLTRKPYTLTMAVDKKNVYEQQVPEAPFIHYPENTIQLFPGETLYVEIEQTDGVIKSMKAVKEITDSSKTITIAFYQVAEKNIHKSMMLKVQNPFPYQLSYGATMFLLKQKKWYPTDVWPVQPKLIGYETWGDIITSIGLAKWSFMK